MKKKGSEDVEVRGERKGRERRGKSGWRDRKGSEEGEGRGERVGEREE